MPNRDKSPERNDQPRVILYIYDENEGEQTVVAIPQFALFENAIKALDGLCKKTAFISVYADTAEELEIFNRLGS